MVCINKIFGNPLTSAIAGGIIVMFYILTMSYSPYLPPAIILSVIVALFIYAVLGGTIRCADKKFKKLKS
jgi:hypothetical protein